MGTSTHGAKPKELWKNLSFWCLHAYQYQARLRLDSEWFDISPGVVSVVPPNTELEYHFQGPSPHTYVHFDLPGAAQARRRLWKPNVYSLRVNPFRRFDASLREAVAWFPSQMLRARVRLWDLLWQLVSDEPATSTGKGDPRVQRALEAIESRLDSSLCVADLAASFDLSAAQLVRLFHQYVGVAPLSYIHRRRADRAEHLLKHTTLPIKSIARQVGMNDLQQFNKLLRRMLGHSPRAIRNSA